MNRLIQQIAAAGVAGVCTAGALVFADDPPEQKAKPAAPAPAPPAGLAPAPAPAAPVGAMVNGQVRVFFTAPLLVPPPPAPVAKVDAPAVKVEVKAVAKLALKRAQAAARAKELRPNNALEELLGAAVKGLVKAPPMNAIPIAAPPPALAAMDPMAAQYLPQFRQLARTEVHLAQAVCKLAPDQRKKIDKAATAAAIAASKKYGEFQQKMMQGQWNGVDPMPDPRALMLSTLAPVFKEHLTTEQTKRYRVETDQRNANRRLATVQNLIARLDQELVLSAEQREKLSESLLKHWQDGWTQTVEMLQSNEQIIPNIPDPAITPFLNNKQKQVWQSAPKNGGFFFGGFGLDMVLDADIAVLNANVAQEVEAVIDVVAPAQVEDIKFVDVKPVEAKPEAAKPEEVKPARLKKPK